MPDPALLPLFPLRTVLVPGGVLDLRIFERRYLDMVAACGRSGHGFGVCLILAGEEVGAPATPAEWGTEAVIEDFGHTADGLLALRVRGRRRFRAGPPQVQPDGLLQAEVAWLPEPQPSPRLRPEHALLAELLRRILAQAGPAAAEPAPALFEDAAWVGWRLAEWLPLSASRRLQLLQMDDPHARLQALLDGLSEEPAPG